jgi:predicted Zn-dependent peptidase
MSQIPIHQRTLDNGLLVVVCPDHGSPSVNVTVMYHVGSHDEQPERTGLAHLFEHLMFDNTTTGAVKQYDTYCTKAGGSNNAFTTYDYTTYYINLPAHQIEIGLWLESERMRGFMITDHALATQRSVVVEEIKQNVDNQPYGSWGRVMQQTAYAPACSYSWDVYGNPEHVAAVSMDDARGFFEQFYHPRNAVLVIAGDIEPDRGYALAEKYFGDIAAGPLAMQRNPYDKTWRRKGVARTIEDAVPMPAVFAAFHMPGIYDDRTYAAEIAASIIGSGRSSPLYRSLVSRRHIASHTGAYVQHLENTSQLILYAYAATSSITSDQLTEALTDTVRSVDLTPAMQQKAVNKLRTGIASELQRNEGIAENVAFNALFHRDPSAVNRLLDLYQSQTLEQVREYIEDCSDLENGVLVDVVPQ